MTSAAEVVDVTNSMVHENFGMYEFTRIPISGEVLVLDGVEYVVEQVKHILMPGEAKARITLEIESLEEF